MRFRTKTIVVTMLAVGVGMALAAGAARASEGPYFQVDESRLEEGGTEEVKETAKSSLQIEATSGQLLTCTGTKLAAGALLDGSTGPNSSTAEETIEYTGCTVSGNGSGCKVEGEKITTSKLRATLGYSKENREGLIMELLKPASGTVIAEPKFSGSCTVSSTQIKGLEVGEFAGYEEESTEHELKFTKAAQKIWTESSETLTSSETSLEMFKSSSKQAAVEQVVEPARVAMFYLTGSSACNAPLTMFLTKCNNGAYFPANETFEIKNLTNFEIVAGAQKIICTESDGKFKLGTNPNLTGVKLKIEEWDNTSCETAGAEPCILLSGTVTALPWNGSMIWTKIGTIGTNGFMTFSTVSITAFCGGAECTYEGGNVSKSMGGGIFNANDTNKPAVSAQAELQFDKAPMKGIGPCAGNVAASAIYEIVPKEAGKKLYLTMQ